MAERKLSIRLSLEEAETVKRALDRLGQDGQAALRRIETGAKGPTSGLVALNAASLEVQGTMGGMASRLGPVGAAMAAFGPAGTAAAAGIAAVGAAILGGLAVTRDLERLEASLQTVTGSTIAAEAAFEQIKAFAADTPFGLEQVTEAFIKLKALGLDPSQAALTSYGNTASGMGKALSQFIEAVADATTGEFERLKEFGIVARTEGDNVTFTFRGLSTTVRKEAGAIEGYLRRLGEVEFAGGMERQAKTLDGVTGNLTDAWRLLLAEFSNTTGATAGTKAVLRELTEMANELRAALKGADIQVEFTRVFEAARKLEGEIATLRGRGISDDDPAIARRLEGLSKLQAAQAKLQAQILTKTDAAGADAARQRAEADAMAAAKADQRTAAVKSLTDEQRKALDLARLEADTRAERKAADEAEADLKERVADATAGEIAAARQRAVEIVRTERETAAATKGVADAQREKEQAAKKAATEAKRAADEQAKIAAADEKAIKQLRDELALLTAVNEQERIRIERDQFVRAARADIQDPSRRAAAGTLAGQVFDAGQANVVRDAGKQVFEETRTAAERYGARLQELGTLARAGAIDQETYARATAAAKEEMRRASDGAGDLSTALMGGVGHALMSLRGDFENFGDVAISVLQHVVLELIRMQEAASKAGKSGPLSGIMNAIGGGIGGLFVGGGSPGLSFGAGDTTGAGGAGFSYTSFGGPRAAGGPVDPSKWYMVGERGPEPFVPNVPGTIIPNRNVSGGGGGGSSGPTNIVINAPGADAAALARVEAAVRDLDRTIEARSVRAVQGGRALDPRFMERGSG